jgi:hypothetical protein
MSYKIPNVYITVDAGNLVPTELPDGGNVLMFGTANKGLINTAVPVSLNDFNNTRSETNTYGTIDSASGSTPDTLVRAIYHATKDSNAFVWAVRVADSNVASASGTLQDATPTWGIDLTSYYKGTWYEGTAQVASGSTTNTWKITINGSSTTNFAGWYEVWDNIPNTTTCSGAVDIINGLYTGSDSITYRASESANVGSSYEAWTVNNTTVPAVAGSKYFTAAVSGATGAVTLTETASRTIGGANDGTSSLTVTDIETIHRTYFSMEDKYDILHFAGTKIEDCATQIISAVDNAAQERAWRIAVQGTDEPATKTAAQAVSKYTTNTTTHEHGGLIKWSSCWADTENDPYEVAQYGAGANPIDIDSIWTAAWFCGELAAPNATGVVDETQPKDGTIVNYKPKYSFNTVQLEQLIDGKLTFTNKLDDYRMKVIRAQTAYAEGEGSAYRNIGTPRILNTIKRLIVDIGSRFIRRTKNTKAVRMHLKEALIKAFDILVAQEKIVEYKNLRVYASRQDEIDGICRVYIDVAPVMPLLFVDVNIILT